MDQFKFSNAIALKPAAVSDKSFIVSLFRSSRAALLAAEGEADFLETIVEHQYELQQRGYFERYPNAMTLVVYHLNERIGRVMVDFDSNVVHLIDIMLLPKMTNKGHGQSIVQSLQNAAAKVAIPMTLIVDQQNIMAKKMYTNLGFSIYSIKPPLELLVWYPTRN